jgi:protein TonB
VKNIAAATAAALFLLAPGTGLAGGPGVDCLVTVNIGYPAAAGNQEGSVYLAPGSVIALATPEATPTAEEQSAAVADSLARSQLWEQLVTTFRLDGGRHRTTTKAMEFYPGDEAKLEPNSNLDVHVRLESLTSHAAAFRVLFKSGGSVLSDTPVTVARGSRAVVGATDGAEAPYIFVVLEPAARNSSTPVRFRMHAGLTEPRIVKKVNPQYPEDARNEKVQGTVLLEVVIRKDGTVGQITPLRSTDDRLSKAAVAAVRQWRFEPSRDKSGKAVAVRYVLTTRFVLQ